MVTRVAHLCFIKQFSKSSISWPQQPPTEKVLNFNMIFHDSTKKYFSSKHHNKAGFKNLDDSEVPSSDFPDLRAIQFPSFHYETPCTYSQTNFLWPYYLCMKVKWRSDFCCLLCTIDFLSCEHEGFKLELTLFSCNGYLVFNFIVKSAEFQLLANKQLSREVWLLKEG